MSRWRVILVVLLLGLPFLLLAGVGTYYLWSLSWGIVTWAVMVVSMSAGYLLAWRWQRKNKLLRPPDFENAGALDRTRQPGPQAGSEPGPRPRPSSIPSSSSTRRFTSRPPRKWLTSWPRSTIPGPKIRSAALPFPRSWP